MLEDEFIQVSALLNPARGCRVSKRSVDADIILNYYMPSVDVTLPIVQVLFNKYKDKVPNPPRFFDDEVVVVDDSLTVIVPPTEMSRLLRTAGTNSSVAMFSVNVRSI